MESVEYWTVSIIEKAVCYAVRKPFDKFTTHIHIFEINMYIPYIGTFMYILNTIEYWISISFWNRFESTRHYPVDCCIWVCVKYLIVNGRILAAYGMKLFRYIASSEIFFVVYTHQTTYIQQRVNRIFDVHLKMGMMKKKCRKSKDLLFKC